MADQYVGISDFINLRASVLRLEKIRAEAQTLIEEFEQKREHEKKQRAQILMGLKYLTSVQQELDSLLPELEEKEEEKKEVKKKTTIARKVKKTPKPRLQTEREIKSVNPTEFVSKIKSLRNEFEKIKKEI